MVRLSTAIAKNTFSNTSDDYDQSRELQATLIKTNLFLALMKKVGLKTLFAVIFV